MILGICVFLPNQNSYYPCQSLQRIKLKTVMPLIRVYDKAANAIETHEHAGNFKEW